VATGIAAPATPAAGKGNIYFDSTSKNLCAKDDAGFIKHGVQTKNGVASQFLTAISDLGSVSAAQPAFTDLSGTLAGGQFGPLTGDVTTSGYAATNVNAPDGFTQAGKVVATAIAAPGTPAAGKGHLYVDSTSKNICLKDDAGFVKHGVQTKNGTANQFLTAISDLGSVSAAQPDFSNLSGAATLAQLGSGAALSVLGQPANASGTRSDIAASASSDFPLRERSGALGFGTLSTPAYGANSVTYAKLQVTSAGKVLLGRDVGAGTVQEIGIDATLKMTSGVLGEAQPYGWGLTFGGNMNNSVGTTFPVFLGLGTQDWSTSSSLGMRAPSASSHQDWCVHVVYNALTGGGTMELDVFVNGVNQGAIAFYNSGATNGYLSPGTSFVIASGDLISIRMTTFSGTINGGTIQLFVVGRFAF
jgi:hypothetical protein